MERTASSTPPGRRLPGMRGPRPRTAPEVPPARPRASPRPASPGGPLSDQRRVRQRASDAIWPVRGPWGGAEPYAGSLDAVAGTKTSPLPGPTALGRYHGPTFGDVAQLARAPALQA